MGLAQATGNPSDTASWQVNPAEYQDNMILTAALLMQGEESGNPQHVVAAFIDGDCRGVGRLVYVPALDRHLLTLFIYGNSEDLNATVHFRVFDAAAQEVREINQTIPFQADGIVGKLSNPFLLSAATFFTTIHHRDLRCATDRSAFAVAVVEGGAPPYTYTWSNGSTSSQIINLDPGWYYLTVTDQEGTSVSDSIEIRNLEQPIALPELSPFPGHTICGGEDVFIINLADEADLTRWYDERDTLLGTGAWLSLPEVMQQRRITARHDLSGCLSSPVDIAINTRGPDAEFTVTPGGMIEPGGLVQFQANASAVDHQFFWQFGDGGWSTYQDPYYFYNLTGEFDVALEVTDPEGCRSRVEKTAFIKVAIPSSGLQPGLIPASHTENLSATVFPNPFMQEVLVVWKVKAVGDYTVRLFNLAGKLLTQQQWWLEKGTAQRSLNLGEVAPVNGVYLLEISGPTSKSTIPLLKKN